MDKDTKARMREITSALGKYGFGKILNKTITDKILPGKAKDEESDFLMDNEIPLKLRLMFQELGTSFIKLGQLLSTRPDMVGDRLAAEFEKLQDDNPPISYEEVKRIVERELGGNIDELFAEFSEESLATASIGQVHAARLPTGEKVAVKVQKEGIADKMESDLIIMKKLGRKIPEGSDELRKYNIPGILDEFERSLKIEIDYINELINMKRFEENCEEEGVIHIPTAYPEYCTSKVLTMEFIEGTKLQDVYTSTSDEFDKPLLAKRALDSFMKQVLIDGFFHADPHPGNIMVLDDNVVCFLDLGSVGMLDDRFRKDLCDMLMLIADQDVDGLVNQFIYMGVLEYNMDTTDLKRDLRDLFFRYFSDNGSGLSGSLDKILSLMQDYGIILPNVFVIMARGISMIESVATTLDPNIDMMASIEPIAKETVKDRLNLKNYLSSKKGSLLYYKNMLKSVLPLLTNAIHKIENGEMKIKFEIDGLNELVNKTLYTFVLCALLISSSLVMTITTGPMLFGMPMLGVIGYFLTAIMAVLAIINYVWY